MADLKEVAGGVEWRVTVPEGSTVKIESEYSRVGCIALFQWFFKLVLALRSKALGFLKRAWSMGVNDPRKAIHGLKVGLALSLVSLFYYTRPLYEGVGGNAMWAIMTVVVIFEFQVGGSLYKGINRATATTTAGSLAIGVHWVASKSGHRVEPVILTASVFLLASAATFSRFMPAIKAKFDYGITIFILTFSLVAVSGYRVEELLKLAQLRVSTIIIGVSICFFVCILIFPVWAGEDLHMLIVRNMENIADSLEGCVEEYFETDGSVAKGEVHSHKSQKYKCVLNSKASEDSLANLARWEPAHGNFIFRHPWSQYLKVGAAMRYCAYCVEALNGCINSEVQAPEFIKKHLSDACTRLSTESSNVLKESASSIKLMKRSACIELLVAEMNDAVQELHMALQTLPNSAASEEEKTPPITVPACVTLMEALPLVTVVSLMVEISARIEGVVDAVDRLADHAEFKPADEDKPEKTGSKEEAIVTVTSNELEAKTLELA